MTMTTTGLGMEVTKELLGAMTVEDLQGLLEQKQQEARAGKIKRRDEVDNALRMAQDELDMLEQEIGVQTQQRPIVRQQRVKGIEAAKLRSSMVGVDGRKYRAGYGEMARNAAAALREGKRPMTAGEVAAAMKPPGSGERVASYLKGWLERREVRRYGEPKKYRYQWVGGGQ